MPRGWPKNMAYDPEGAIPPRVRQIVATGIERAKRNVAEGLPFDAGSDTDAVLVTLGLPPRPAAVYDPFDLAAEFITESKPLRVHPRKGGKKPAA